MIENKKNTNIKLTIDEIKNKLYLKDKDIIILSDKYVGNKAKLDLRCVVCDVNFNRTWNDLSRSKSGGCPYCGKNGVKVSKQDIASRLSSFGYKLVEITKYDSNKGTCFKVECEYGHEYETSFREFNREESKRSGSCKSCVQEGNGKVRLNRLNHIKNRIEELGYTVENNHQVTTTNSPFTFLCANNHPRTISLNSLEATPKCAQCEGRILRHTEESISDSLKAVGLEYISGFTTTLNLFTYKCECGNVDKGKYHMLLDGNRCGNCLERKHWRFDKVVEMYKSLDCELKETSYTNNKIPMKFKCRCGEDGEKPFADFLVSPCCRECGKKNKARGENHFSWNPNLTDEERLNGRKHYLNTAWRNDTFKRDNYTCQCCGDDKGGNLQAHHLNSHDWDIDGRLDLNNSVTLCSLCHVDFHKLYGFGNNTKEQYEEYIEELYENIVV